MNRIVVALVAFLVLSICPALPAEGQAPALTTWEKEVVLPRFAPIGHTKVIHLTDQNPTVTITNQSLTPEGQQLHIEFQRSDPDPSETYNIGYLDSRGNFVPINNVWSSTGTTAFNFPSDVYRIRCSINVNWSAGGYLWLPEWDTDGFFGLSRRFVSVDYQGKELSFITNVRSPIGIMSDSRTYWLEWYTIDYGVYRSTISNFTTCNFSIPIEGYPIIFLNSPIAKTGQDSYRISANCLTPTPVPTIPAPTPMPTIPATPTPFRAYMPLLLR